MNIPVRASAYCAMSLVLFSLAGGCVAVNGGAVELSWTVRTTDARPVDCDMAMLSSVSLCVQACDSTMENGDCLGETQCPFQTFTCDRLRGATDFAIAPGRKRLWITASCANGQAPDITVPEAVLRDVINGDVTELNALLISVPSDGLACGS